MKLIFERSRPGRGNGLLPSLDVPAAPLPEKYPVSYTHLTLPTIA